MNRIQISKPKKSPVKGLHLLRHPFTTVNYGRMLDGIAKAKECKIIIVGCCRNVTPKTSNDNFLKCKILGKNFLDYQIVAFQNDSINELVSVDDKVTVINKTYGYKTLGAGRDYRRVKLMTQFRNECFRYVQDKYSDFDYVLVIDYDLTEWRIDGIFNSLAYPDDKWDMIGANGIQVNEENREVYYDTFALIDSNMGLYDQGVSVPIFDIEKPLWKTFACFGGIALYRMEPFLSSGGYAVCSVHGKICSEQCSICLHMHLAGFDKIYINPSMILLR